MPNNSKKHYPNVRVVNATHTYFGLVALIRHNFPQEAVLLTKLQRRHKTGLVNLVCGGWHNVVSTTSGHLAAWGAGDSGQLGNGLQCDQVAPTLDRKSIRLNSSH